MTQKLNKVLALSALSLACASALASSHREGPAITGTPKVDATDFYMFRSTEAGRQDYVTLIANYQPVQDTYGGPNYFTMDPNALYEIHVDNNGDAQEDISFQFKFSNNNKAVALPIRDRSGATTSVEIPLVIAGTVARGNESAINLEETYQVGVAYGGRRNRASSILNGGNLNFSKPLDYVGDKTFGSASQYEQYAQSKISTISLPNCNQPAKVFVGQRQDPFFVALGKTFDLVNFSAADVTGANGQTGGRNTLDGKAVTAIALEVHKSCLTSGADPVLGAWTTASVRQYGATNLSTTGVSDDKKHVGAWSQVSRLGMPLVNEVVIGLADKNRFNTSHPSNDTKDAKFGKYVTHPTFPALVELLFGVQAPPAPRLDLVATFLTGIPGVNKPSASNAVPSEMLRLNTSVPVTPLTSANQLGVIGGDSAGYPNGRRVIDDVVDITLRVAEGALCGLNNQAVFGCVPADAPAAAVAFTDRVRPAINRFPNQFPYMATPSAGSNE